MKSVAAVTMVYNEDVFLPIWIRYYGELFGEKNLYILDNESTDSSTSALGSANVIRVPRTEHFNLNRRLFISQFCSALLQYFDAVVYTDCDEILFTTTRVGTLGDYIEQLDRTHATAVGLELFQDLNGETEIDLTCPILEQRKKAFFSAPMCKTLVIQRPITWSSGFHLSTRRPVFDRLLLVHLSNMDLKIRLQRQALMRTIEAVDLGPHKRTPDSVVCELFKKASSKEVSAPRELFQLRKQFIESVEFFPRTGFYGLAPEARQRFPLRVFHFRSIVDAVVV